MEIKKFDNGLIVKSRKSAVIFEANLEKGRGYQVPFNFTKDGFNDFIKYIEFVSRKAWTSITPKDATSEASDYWEYYDKQLDNNGYLRIGDNHLLIDRPDLEGNRLYQFNKPKMQSFLFDLKKKVTS